MTKALTDDHNIVVRVGSKVESYHNDGPKVAEMRKHGWRVQLTLMYGFVVRSEPFRFEQSILNGGGHKNGEQSPNSEPKNLSTCAILEKVNMPM